MPVPLCPVPGSDDAFLEAVQDVAAGCAQPGWLVVAHFQRSTPRWFAVIGVTDDFKEATGKQLQQLQLALWRAGFNSDAIARLVNGPRRAWGLRVWREDSEGADYWLIRSIVRQCGYPCS